MLDVDSYTKVDALDFVTVDEKLASGSSFDLEKVILCQEVVDNQENSDENVAKSEVLTIIKAYPEAMQSLRNIFKFETFKRRVVRYFKQYRIVLQVNHLFKNYT